MRRWCAVPKRILHVADLHTGIHTHGHVDPRTGVNTRSLELMRSFKWLIGLAEELRPDVIALGGDDAHGRTLVGPDADALASLYQSLASIAPTVSLEGNHTAETGGQTSLCSVLADVCHVQYASTPMLIEAGGVMMQLLPYPSRAAIEAAGWSLSDAGKHMSELIGTSAAQHPGLVCAGHFTVSGSRYSSEAQPLIQSGLDFMVDASTFDDPNIAVALMGHIHNRQQIGKAVYAGSLMALSFGEEDQATKGAQLVTVDGTGAQVTHYENPESPRFLTITVASDEDIPDFRHLGEAAYLRVKADRSLDGRERAMIAEYALDMGAKLRGIIEKPERTMRTMSESLSHALSDHAIVQAYCESVGVSHPEQLVELMQAADGML